MSTQSQLKWGNQRCSTPPGLQFKLHDRGTRLPEPQLSFWQSGGMLGFQDCLGQKPSLDHSSA